MQVIFTKDELQTMLVEFVTKQVPFAQGLTILGIKFQDSYSGGGCVVELGEVGPVGGKEEGEPL